MAETTGLLAARPTRVAAYARVSTGPGMQADNFSLAAQLNEIRKFAAGRGWTVVAEFTDTVSGQKTADRPGLQEMLAAARRQTFDVLIVHELSRLSRASVYDTFAIFEDLGRAGVGFVSVLEPQFDLSNPSGRFVLTIIAAINQYYVDVLRLHTRKGKHQRARDGLYNASILPYGYRRAGDNPKEPPVIVEEEAAGVRLIFELYATGRYSVQDLANTLNDRGFRTRSGQRFSKDTVADMLRNPFYQGQVAYKAYRQEATSVEWHTGQHQAIVTPELWAACRQVRERHLNASRPFQPQVRAYPLGQLVVCHVCGRKLRAQHTNTGDYYRELSGSRGYDDCPQAQTGARAAVLQAQIDALVRQLQLPPDWQAELQTLMGEDEEVLTLQNARARLVAERRRIKQAWIRGDYEDDVDLYESNLRRVEQELAQLPTADELYQVQQAAEQLEHVAEVWDVATERDKKELLQLMLQSVAVDVTQNRVLFLRPTAAFIPLLRSLPLLQERGLGQFTPVWSPELAATLPYPSPPPLTQLPTPAVALPWLGAWPWAPEPGARISPTLSQALKERRQSGQVGGLVVEVPYPGVPALRVDSRKWEGVELKRCRLAEVLTWPADSVAYLETPLALQELAERETWPADLYERLAPQGYWHWIDWLPGAMPAHWVFTYFPTAWSWAQQHYWSNYDSYNRLRQVGFQVEQREHTWYQALTLETAWAIAQQRPGLLAALPEAEYQAGLAALRAALEAQGAGALQGSEVTLVEVWAVKGARPARRRGKAAAPVGE